jgi:hypothetical protein
VNLKKKTTIKLKPPQDFPYKTLQNGPGAEMVKVAALNLADTTRNLYSGCKELQDPGYYLSSIVESVYEQFMDTCTELKT